VKNLLPRDKLFPTFSERFSDDTKVQHFQTSLAASGRLAHRNKKIYGHTEITEITEIYASLAVSLAMPIDMPIDMRSPCRRHFL
jgi:hypothetical protein